MKKRPVHRTAPVAEEEAEGPPPEGPLPLEPPAPLPTVPDPPVFRPLRVFAFDPSQTHIPGNVMTIPVRYEPLRPGPVGGRVAVVDYDFTRNCFYDPVDLDDPLIALRGGLDPSESDPRFHQQMVYAVTCETLRRVEAALGRPAARRTAGESAPLRLFVYPHAMRAGNSFARGDGALLFGYFRASAGATGRTTPGQTVFTCLSHDVVVHTALHAIVGAMRPDLQENWETDVAAFHEGFSDGMALLLHFSYREAVLDTIQRTAGSIHRTLMRGSSGAADAGALVQAEVAVGNPLLAMGNEFGEALGRTGGLRSALGRPPDPRALETVTEPHERGGILVAALFDAFFTVYVQRSVDLFRIYRAGGGRGAENDLPAPLAERLFAEVDAIARRLFETCVRALDYLPPSPFALGDYLRACITADYETVPADEWGLREALMQAFRCRGLKPSAAQFFSEEALRWPRVQLKDALIKRSPEDLRAFVARNAKALGLRAGAPAVVYPLEMARVVTADARVQDTFTTQAMQAGRGEEPARGVSLVFDGAGALRYAVPSCGGGAEPS